MDVVSQFVPAAYPISIIILTRELTRFGSYLLLGLRAAALVPVVVAAAAVVDVVEPLSLSKPFCY